MKTLVWVTHSFRLDSRLMHNIKGQCTFVYYSPYYFAGEREKQILSNCSTKNIELFHSSITQFTEDLNSKGHSFYVFKESDPVSHINYLCDTYGFDQIIIDQPLFAMWQTIKLENLKVPHQQIDSDLVDDTVLKMTAKSRWMTHTKQLQDPYEFSSDIESYSINEISKPYPKAPRINTDEIINRALKIAKTYKHTRDKHNGQTELSTWFQNGVIDPHNTFFAIAKQFERDGADFTVNDHEHAAMLRQFGFREITIIQTRQRGLTMEMDPSTWAAKFITEKSYNNLIDQVNPDSTLTFDQIRNANTMDSDINQILRESFNKGVMPNRARMYFAGWMFYNAPTGIDALNWIILTFDLLLNDGQCPTNYTQSCSSMNLQYGRVMLLNKNRVMDLLAY